MGSRFSVLASTQWYFEGSRKYGKKGFQQASKSWDPKALDKDLSGLNYLITGANSGLGFETARQFAFKNATVHMLCRNEEKANAAKQKICDETRNQQVHVHVVDMSDFDSIRNFATQYNEEWGTVKVLINNAGLMPDTLTKSKHGIEVSFATMIGGTYLLTKLLLPSLKAGSPSHVINVSSGGMYTAKMDLSDINFDKTKYDALFAYSNSKRAMVYLTELWTQEVAAGVYFHSMHPGWTDTPGVRTAMPKFAEKQGDDLRTLEQGIDTIIWLGTRDETEQLPNGEFWFDREVAPKDMSIGFTKNSDQDKQQLWRLCEKLCDDSSNIESGAAGTSASTASAQSSSSSLL